MDTNTYQFSDLVKKYDGFRGPAFTVTVNNTTFHSYEIPFSVEIDICANGSAGGCQIQIESQYDYANGKWYKDLIKTIKVGAKLEILGGYVKQENLFYGYVDEITINYTASGAPNFSITGVDGLGYLANFQEPSYGGEQEPPKVVDAILSKAKSAKYATDITIGTLPAFDAPPVQKHLNDLKYLHLLAERYGVTLMAVNGELIFDDVMKDDDPILVLTVGMGLMEFQKRLSLQNQVAQIEIQGYDDDKQPVVGVANSVSVGGSGKSATEIADKFKETKKVEENIYARTVEDCKKLAQAELDRAAMGFVTGAGSCIGIPELIPGRFITIEGLDGETVGDYFITRVHHSFNQSGYMTQFEVKGAKD